MEIEVFKTEHLGVNYTHLRLNKIVDGVISHDNHRYVVKGYPKITIMKNSYKFGNQIQFSLCSSKNSFKNEDRNTYSNWDTLEINIPFDDGVKMVEAVMEELKKNYG